MSSKTFSLATLSGLFAAMVGLIVLVGCGGGSSGGSTTTGSPAVTLSAASLTFSSAVGVASAPQSVTVTNSGTATLDFSSIQVTAGASNFSASSPTCGTGIAAGTACSISVTFTPTAAGTVSGTLSITDNASGSPQTVSLSGAGTSVSVSPNSLTFSDVAAGTTSAALSVTLNNVGATALTITSITITAGSPIFFLATLPTPTPSNYCGTSVAANSSCVIYGVTFAPTTGGTFDGTLTIVDGAGTQTVALTGSTTALNTVPISINFGPYGNEGLPTATTSSYYDAIFTTVTVCEPGSTTNCAAIPDVLVDTGSEGLRVYASQLGSVTLPSISLSGGTLYECAEFAESYTWGPVQMATVQIGGETASQLPSAYGGTANSGIPIQVITDNGAAPSGAPCVTAGLFNTNTPSALGANGLLGIGVSPQDCWIGGTNPCESSGSDDLYLTYSGGAYSYASVPLAQQAWNPVAAFSSSDTNGVVVTLPPLYTPPSPDVGAATATGTLTFGINTANNNQIPGTANVYQLDEYGYFESSTFGGVTYNSNNSYGSFLDTGSSAYFVSDDVTLSSVLDTSVSDCLVGSTDIGYFCSTLTIPLGLQGTNMSQPITVDLPIANAFTLFDANPTFAAFDNLGGPSCIPATNAPCNAATDSWDLGLPFLFGKTIYFGMAGTTVGGVTSTDGYYAF
jgi:hypothetical protein